MKFLKESDKALVKDIDNKVKNKWSWKWAGEVLSRDVPKVGPVTYTLGECLVKIDVAGVAFCKWCEDKVAYGGNGKKHLVAHCNTDKHVQRLRVRCTNYSLGGTFTGAQKDSLQTAAAARRVREKNVVLSFTKHQRMALKRKPADKSQKPSSSNQKGAKKRRL